MTDDVDLETRLGRWFSEEAAVRPPERLAHSTRERIATTGQVGRSRAWLALPTGASRLAMLVLAGALVLTVVAAGSFFVLGSRQGANPSRPPTPRPSLTSLTAFACPPSGGSCLGPLPAGVFETHSFLPQVGYATNAGWANTLDSRGQVDLSFTAGGSYRYPDGTVFHDGISIFARPIAESGETGLPLDGVGKTAGALAHWLDGNPNLDATGLAPVTIGGLSGWRITISVANRPRVSPDHCAADHGEPACVSLFVSDDPEAHFSFGIVGPESAIVYLLDTPSGETVMAVVDDVDGIDRDALVAAAEPVIDSLEFR